MLVSLIIPVYKVEAYIINCLSSVYAQTYDKIEVIIVDDCSPDNSLAIAGELIKDMSDRYTVKIIEHTENRGLSAARNSGVCRAKGDYLFFLDSDDELPPDSITVLVRKLISAGREVDFVIGAFKLQNVDYTYPQLKDASLLSNESVLHSYLDNQWPVMACNKLIRRSFFLDYALWFEDGLLHEDELFSFNLARVGRVVCITNIYTYIYKIRDSGSITSDIREGHYKSMLRINDIRYDFFKESHLVIDKRVLTKFYIDTTFEFIRSADLNINLSRHQRKFLIKSQLKMFLRDQSFKNLFCVFKYRYYRLLYILKDSLLFLFLRNICF